MNATLPRASRPHSALRGHGRVDFGGLVVAALYAALLVAAPAIIRYAPAPSATPVVVTPAVVTTGPDARHDCAAAPNAPACARTAPR